MAGSISSMLVRATAFGARCGPASITSAAQPESARKPAAAGIIRAGRGFLLLRFAGLFILRFRKATIMAPLRSARQPRWARRLAGGFRRKVLRKWPARRLSPYPQASPGP